MSISCFFLWYLGSSRHLYSRVMKIGGNPYTNFNLPLIHITMMLTSEIFVGCCVIVFLFYDVLYVYNTS